VYEHTKRRSVLAQLSFSHSWLSYPFLRPRRINSEVIVIEDHLKLVEEIHNFHLDPTLCNLKVCSSTFICLKLLTQSAKNIKTEASLLNVVSIIFFSLSLKGTSFRVFNLGLINFDWVPVLQKIFNCTHNYL